MSHCSTPTAHFSRRVVFACHTDRPPLHEEDPPRCRGIQCLGWRAWVPGPPCGGLCPPVSCRVAQRLGRGSHHHQVTQKPLSYVLFQRQMSWTCTVSWKKTGIWQQLTSFRLRRFLFILLGPLGKGPQYHEIGRSIATLMTDEVRPTEGTLFSCIWKQKIKRMDHNLEAFRQQMRKVEIEQKLVQ